MWNADALECFKRHVTLLIIIHASSTKNYTFDGWSRITYQVGNKKRDLLKSNKFIFKLSAINSHSNWKLSKKKKFLNWALTNRNDWKTSNVLACWIYVVFSAFFKRKSAIIPGLSVRPSVTLIYPRIVSCLKTFYAKMIGINLKIWISQQKKFKKFKLKMTVKWLLQKNQNFKVLKHFWKIFKGKCASVNHEWWHLY